MTAPFPFTVEDAFRRARLDSGLSVHEIADQLGVHYQTVLRWETGEKTPGGKNLAKFIRITSATWLPDALEDLESRAIRCYVDLAGEERAEELVAA